MLLIEVYKEKKNCSVFFFFFLRLTIELYLRFVLQLTCRRECLLSNVTLLGIIGPYSKKKVLRLLTSGSVGGNLRPSRGNTLLRILKDEYKTDIPNPPESFRLSEFHG